MSGLQSTSQTLQVQGPEVRCQEHFDNFGEYAGHVRPTSIRLVFLSGVAACPGAGSHRRPRGQE
eukprot:3231208-Pyramimonas_sp.AAC.1